MTIDKRCGCGAGECWDCWMDNLDEEYERDPKYRECTCDMSCCAVCNYYRVKLLDKKGFVFIDDNKLPYRCSLWKDEIWMSYWHIDKKWVTFKRISEKEARDCAGYYVEEQEKYLEDISGNKR